jgi:hypothetical protein
MHHWAGMLTEDQHAHAVIQQAMKQASWDLFFRSNPVCEPPAFVADPHVELAELLQGQPLNILVAAKGMSSALSADATSRDSRSPEEIVRALRARSNQSWSNITKAIGSLQGQRDVPFGTASVEASAKSTVRRMCREAGLQLHALEAVVARLMAR